jgi:hypothetical protein
MNQRVGVRSFHRYIRYDLPTNPATGQPLPSPRIMKLYPIERAPNETDIVTKALEQPQPLTLR